MGKPNPKHVVSCHYCKTEFLTGISRKFYCSRKCCSEDQNRIRREQRQEKIALIPERNCQWCDKLFKPRLIHQRSCSKLCYDRMDKNVRRDIPLLEENKTLNQLIVTRLGIPGEYRQTIGGV